MFKQTRRRLALINSLVFFLIFIAFCILLYVHMQSHLFRQADEALLTAESRVQHARLEDMLRANHPEPQTDRQTIYLFWNSQGELVEQTPRQAITVEQAKRFRVRGSLTSRTMSTVQIDGHSFRILTIPNQRIGAGASGQGTDPTLASTIAMTELVRSLEAEEGLLRSLRFTMVVGIAIGGLVSLVAGFFLAGRSLVPIRRSWEKQQQFVADASHELRTPTAVIQARTELLFRHPDRTIEQESQSIANILKESKRMGKLVDDLLTLARSDSNQLQLQLDPLSLERIMDEMIGQFQFLADTKEINIQTNIQRPQPFFGDEERIRQLLVILLDNALKFTPAGGTITVTCRKQTHTVQLSVKDSGCGISGEDLPFIFERFYRGDKARTRTEGGTGLGLSIAKWIVEAHGGEIRVQSELAVGTEVIVLLPVKKHPEGDGFSPKPSSGH
jgi:two-component system sensor histidine kinase CiaH